MVISDQPSLVFTLTMRSIFSRIHIIKGEADATHQHNGPECDGETSEHKKTETKQMAEQSARKNAKYFVEVCVRKSTMKMARKKVLGSVRFKHDWFNSTPNAKISLANKSTCTKTNATKKKQRKTKKLLYFLLRECDFVCFFQFFLSFCIDSRCRSIRF